MFVEPLADSVLVGNQLDGEIGPREVHASYCEARPFAGGDQLKAEQSLLFHYSEDPDISRFEPHVPRTNPESAAAVWAIDASHAPLYWFPRDCPRVAVWANDDRQRHRLQGVFGTERSRVQAAPLSWSNGIGSCVLHEYRFAASDFDPWSEAEGQWISHRTVAPLTVAPVGDLYVRHRDANVDLRLLPDLRAFRTAVLDSGLPFSVVRYQR